MSRERGEWIPWYCDDSPGWLELSLAARGAAEGIARKMGARRGELHLGARGLRGLAALLRCDWAELEPALRELTEGDHPRYVVLDGGRILSDPDHATRQRPSSRERMARLRARRAEAPPPPPPAPSPREEIRSDQSRVEETSPPSLGVTSVTSGPPPWFVTTALRVQDDTGEKFGVPEAWIRYAGHRKNKGIAPNANDASYWLGTVMVPEARKERQRASLTREMAKERDDARAPKAEPVWQPPADDADAATPEEHARFAAEIQRRLAGGAR